LYENSTAGYDLAKANLKSPLDSLDRAEKGKDFMKFIVSAVTVVLVMVR
jgi:hypothetical protein